MPFLADPDTGQLLYDSGEKKFLFESSEDCPRDDNICVTFSELVTCCVHLGGGGPWIKTTDISLNGSFELTKTVDLTDLVQWEGLGGDVHFDQYPDSGFDCTGAIEESCDAIGVTHIVVQCRRDLEGVLRHTITYGIEFFDVCVSGWDSQEAQIFRLNNALGVLVFGVPENTEIGCGATGTGRGIAKLGVVSVDAGSCAP